MWSTFACDGCDVYAPHSAPQQLLGQLSSPNQTNQNNQNDKSAARKPKSKEKSDASDILPPTFHPATIHLGISALLEEISRLCCIPLAATTQRAHQSRHIGLVLKKTKESNFWSYEEWKRNEWIILEKVAKSNEPRLVPILEEYKFDMGMLLPLAAVYNASSLLCKLMSRKQERRDVMDAMKKAAEYGNDASLDLLLSTVPLEKKERQQLLELSARYSDGIKNVMRLYLQ